MVRKIEKGGKFRNVHSRTWNMARKLKIMENEKQESRIADSGTDASNSGRMAGFGIKRVKG